MQTRTRITLGLVVAILCLTIGVAAGWRYYNPAADQAGAEHLRLFREVVTIVRNSYVEEVGGKKLLEGAINGMLASLDPHSSYLPPEPFTEMKTEISGSFGGLGIEISMRDSKLTVVAPIEDTPAWRAGIQSGDHIWKIDDTPTRGLTITQAVKRMRGEAGTQVSLSVLRQGNGKPLVFPLVRDIIKTRSLKSRTLEPGYGYVRISQFQERTGDDFVAALAKLRSENGGSLKGLVLDLRNNPGGLLDAAVAVAGRFVGERLDNGLIVYTEGREHFAKRSYSATIGEKEPRYPVVVLINGGSASASEIVAGALQDHGRAVIMGTTSFGKGSVQTVVPLKDGAGLKLTTARYYTPKGRSIQARGIEPDIVVERAEFKELPDKGGAGFLEKDLDNHLSGAETDNGEKTPGPDATKAPAAPATPEHEADRDYKLRRALELLKGWDAMRKVAAAKR